MTVDEPIFHLALVSDWEQDPDRPYTTSTLGKTLAEVGFIHCSFRNQVQQIADLVYRDRDDVVLLTIDPRRVGVPVVVEAADGTEERFPHLYGALERSAVVSVEPFSPS